LPRHWSAWELLPGHCCGRHCTSKGQRKKNTPKDEAHNKPFAICTDIIVRVTTLLVLSDFVKIKGKPIQKLHAREAYSAIVLSFNLLDKISGSSQSSLNCEIQQFLLAFLQLISR